MNNNVLIVPVNPTVKVQLKSELCLEAIAKLLVCVPIRNFKFVDRKVIPFFGKERIIVGNKSFLWDSYGVRCQGNKKSGAMKNCVSVDYQVFGTNFNIKIYKGNLHIVGTKSFDILDNLINVLIKELNCINYVWTKYYNMKIDERKEFIQNIILPIVLDENENLRKIDNIFWELYHKARKENYHMRNVIKCFLSFLFQSEGKKDYLKKIKSLAKLNVGSKSAFCNSKVIKIETIKILECTYTGNLNRDNILLSKLAIVLRERNIDATFHNQRGKFVRIVTDKGLEDENIKKTSSKLPLHQINIFNSGHIRINSPAPYKITLAVARIFIKIVEKILLELDHNEDTLDAVNKRIIENLETFSLKINN